MKTKCTGVPQILMPNSDIDLKSWSVVACDQYTSQVEYWNKTAEIVGTSPSTLNLILPEVHLESDDVQNYITKIHETMKTYLSDNILTELPRGMVLTERFSGSNISRRGIVLAMDLEQYEYTQGSTSLIRPTEKTVVERIPPRLAARNGAVLESPHIMILIDDENRNIIEKIYEKRDNFNKIYDTDLMQDSGHITGWFIEQGENTDYIENELEKLCDRELFNKKYNLTSNLPLLPYAVGDGNHSMATAKAYWEIIKKDLTDDEKQNHPARFVLVEVVNIHDESLIIEPIHRVLFNADNENFVQYISKYYAENDCTLSIVDVNDPQTDGHIFTIIMDNQAKKMIVSNPKWSIPIATLQNAIDSYLETNTNVKIDYIHGQDVVEDICTKQNAIGFLLPDIEKNDLFKGVVVDGVLPRKTFSMGEAHEKRFYMECKKIV